MAVCQKAIWFFNPANPCCNQCPPYCFQEPTKEPEADVWGIAISGMTVESLAPGDGLQVAHCVFDWATCTEDAEECAPCASVNKSWELPWLLTTPANGPGGVSCPAYHYFEAAEPIIVSDGDEGPIWDFFSGCLEENGWIWFPDSSPVHGRRGYWYREGGLGPDSMFWSQSEGAHLWRQNVNVRFVHSIGVCSVTVTITENRPRITSIVDPVGIRGKTTFLRVLGSAPAGRHELIWVLDDDGEWRLSYDSGDVYDLGMSFRCDPSEVQISVTPP